MSVYTFSNDEKAQAKAQALKAHDDALKALEMALIAVRRAALSEQVFGENMRALVRAEEVQYDIEKAIKSATDAIARQRKVIRYQRIAKEVA